MKRAILALLLACCTVSCAWPDRLQYTTEMVEHASMIGVWRAENIKNSEGALSLGRPDINLKGDLPQAGLEGTYSSRLMEAVRRIRDRGPHVLFIHHDGFDYDLVSDVAASEPYNRLMWKVMKEVIAQLDLQKKWKDLPLAEQIERSDLIISGLIKESQMYPKMYTVIPDSTYRGIRPKNLDVLPVGQDKLNTPMLLFIQRYYGSGPDLMLMSAVPLKDAKPYFDEMRNMSSILKTSDPEQ